MSAPGPRHTDRAWFERPAPDVARDLLGCVLVADAGATRVGIVETEAYMPHDPASHSYAGMTTRNAAMFGPAGHLYVYLIYGMHHCINVVTGSEGEGSAVLLRAAEPLEGLAEMQRRRGGALELCRGPGRLAQALGIDRALDGYDLLTGDEVWLERSTTAEEVVTTNRVGISRGTETPWRFTVAGSRWLSGS